MLCSDLQLNEIQLKNYALIEIEKIVQDNGTTIHNFSNELCPDVLLGRDGGNKLIVEELRMTKKQCVLNMKNYIHV